MTYRATVHGDRFAFGVLRVRAGAGGLLATRAGGVSALLAGQHARRIEA